MAEGEWRKKKPPTHKATASRGRERKRLGKIRG
jgi:hypothetical protein